MQSTRRIILAKAAAAAAAVVVAPLLCASANAQAKASKQAMQYQDSPKNGQQCATCLQFIPGSGPAANGTCKVVDGPISPKGWCIAYAKKP